MFKHFGILIASFFITATSAQARNWNIPVPQWITNLSENISVEGTPEYRREVACVALAVYYESRGESVRGQRAVASVVMNRVRDPRFPDSACEVLLQRRQFSFMNGGRVLSPSGAPWSRAVEIAHEFASRSTGEVPYLFFSSERHLRGVRIGNHVFR